MIDILQSIAIILLGISFYVLQYRVHKNQKDRVEKDFENAIQREYESFPDIKKVELEQENIVLKHKIEKQGDKIKGQEQINVICFEVISDMWEKLHELESENIELKKKRNTKQK